MAGKPNSLTWRPDTAAGVSSVALYPKYQRGVKPTPQRAEQISTISFDAALRAPEGFVNERRTARSCRAKRRW